VLQTSDSVKDLRPLTPISFKEELDQILNTITESAEDKRFVYRFSVANEIMLKEALNENPLGLHFSGHGF